MSTRQPAANSIQSPGASAAPPPDRGPFQPIDIGKTETRTQNSQNSPPQNSNTQIPPKIMDENTQNGLTTFLSATSTLIALAGLALAILTRTADARNKKSAEYDKLYSKLEDYIKEQKNYIEHMQNRLDFIHYTYNQKYNSENLKIICLPGVKEEPSFNSPLEATKGMEHISKKIRQSIKETSRKIDEIKKSTAICIKEDWVDEEQRTNFTTQGAASCAIAACKEAEIARKKAGTDTQSLTDQKKYFEGIIKEQIKIAGKDDYLLVPILRPPSTK